MHGHARTVSDSGDPKLKGEKSNRWGLRKKNAPDILRGVECLLFLLRHPRNYCGNLIEYLVPAFQLTAIFCALHRFISNEG